MKTVFNKAEGIKMNSSLDLGSCEHITHEFEYLMDTTETMFNVDVKYFYRVTDDNYIQLATRYNGDSLVLVSQFKLRFKTLKADIVFSVQENIEARYLYNGFPVFQKSEVLTEQEFNSILQTMKDEKEAISERAKAKESPLIQYLRAQKIEPTPTGYNTDSWVSNCPSGGQHFLMIVTTTDTFGCGYCRRKGKLPELKTWLQEVKIKKDQERLSRMLQELNTHGSIQSPDLKTWWMNRY